MTFYEEIHRYYEELFPAGKAQVDFLLKTLTRAKVSSVLDAACGTGAYSRALARAGFVVAGIDYEEAMIEAAKRKGARLSHRLTFQQGDLRLLDALDREFDALICLGNSLPHLLTEEDLEAFFAGSRRLLKNSRGLMILQTVNFDRVLKKQDYQFPVIRREEKQLEFTRFYTPRPDGLLDFHTELVLQGEGEPRKIKNSVPLRPLLKNNLARYLDDSGYKNVRYYGSFDFKPWDLQGVATIVTARAGL